MSRKRGRALRLLFEAVLTTFLFGLRGFSYLVPRDRRLIVFGSWHGSRFSDNPRALFETYRSNSVGKRVVWITRSPDVLAHLKGLGHPASMRHSLKGIWLCLRAATYVYDCSPNDINFWTIGRAKKINLWHGTPLKKIERDITDPHSITWKGYHGPLPVRWAVRFLRPWAFQTHDAVLSPSPEISNIFRHAFRTKKILEVGYPRNDRLLKQKSVRAGGSLRVGYFPTFRSRDNKIPVNWNQFASDLDNLGVSLDIKLHKWAIDDIRLPADCTSIRILNSNIDLQECLVNYDVLVTDYSSVFFDYAILNRPMIFFAYDLESYIQKERGMYFDYETLVPGPIVHDEHELLSALRRLALGHDEFKAKRVELRQRFYPSDDRASLRVISAIQELVP